MSLVRVNLVVVGDPSWQLTHYGFGIWSRTDADVVTLDRANEGFSHSVALWTFERRRPRFEPDVAGEAAGVAGDVAAAVIRKPFDRDGQAIDLAEPVLDGSHHQVAHVLASDAAGSSQEAHGFPITAVEHKHNPHPLAVVTADLKAVGAPTPITFIHRNAAVMAALVPANVAIEQQTVNLHDPVASCVLGGFWPGSRRLPLETGVAPPIAVGRQFGDDRLDLGHQFVVR